MKFEDGEKPKTQKVTVVGEKQGITKDEAVKALGKGAKKFVVETWTAPSEEDEEA